MSIINTNQALQSAIMDVAEVAGHIWQKGWGERNGGNITINITEYATPAWATMPALLGKRIPLNMQLPMIKGAYFYCKGTQKRMRDLSRAPMDNGSIIRITAEGDAYEIIADQSVMPTSELPSHLMVHNYLIESGSTYKATLHTHPIELVAMSHSPRFLDSEEMTQTLWSMIPETLAFAPLGIGVVPYELPGSLELANATLKKIKDYDVTMWEKHGVFAVGLDIMDAFDQVDVLNKAANIYMCARNMGFEPEGMTPNAMQEIQTVFNLPKYRIQ